MVAAACTSRVSEAASFDLDFFLVEVELELLPLDFMESPSGERGDGGSLVELAVELVLFSDLSLFDRSFFGALDVPDVGESAALGRSNSTVDPSEVVLDFFVLRFLLDDPDVLDCSPRGVVGSEEGSALTSTTAAVVVAG